MKSTKVARTKPVKINRADILYEYLTQGEPAPPLPLELDSTVTVTIEGSDSKNDIRRIRAVINKTGQDHTHATCEVKFLDGRTIQFNTSDPNILHMLLSNPEEKDSIALQKGQGPLNWRHHGFFYTKKVQKDYVDMNTIMVDQLTSIAKELGKECHVELIDAGCGQNPELLINLASRAKQENLHVNKATGFDPQSGSIEASKSKVAAMDLDPDLSKTLSLSVGRSEDVEQILGQKPKDVKRILLSSGSFTRFTIQDAFACGTILKSCFRGDIDYLITCGETNALYNKRILKKIGFEITGLHKYSQQAFGLLPTPVRVIKRMSDKKIIGRLIEKAAKKGIIDLRLSPKPDLYLQQLLTSGNVKCEAIKSLDISFSDITHPGKLLQACSQLLPNLEHIDCTLNNTDLLLKVALLSREKNNLSGKINIRYSDDEAELEFSRKFAGRLGYQPQDNVSSKSAVINYLLEKVYSADKTSLDVAVAQFQAITNLLSRQPEYFQTYCMLPSKISLPEKIANCCELLENLSKPNWKYFTNSSGRIDSKKLVELVKLNDPTQLDLVLKNVKLNPNEIDFKELYQTIAACNCDKVLGVLNTCGMLDQLIGDNLLFPLQKPPTKENILHIIARHLMASPSAQQTSTQHNLLLNLLELKPDIKLRDKAQNLKTPADIKQNTDQLGQIKHDIKAIKKHFKQQATPDLSSKPTPDLSSKPTRMK